MDMDKINSIATIFDPIFLYNGYIDGYQTFYNENKGLLGFFVKKVDDRIFFVPRFYKSKKINSGDKCIFLIFENNKATRAYEHNERDFIDGMLGYPVKDFEKEIMCIKSSLSLKGKIKMIDDYFKTHKTL